MIAGTFPGFTYTELLNLDVRDFRFWLREAQRKVLNEKIAAIRLSRMAWAEVDTVRSDIAAYRSAIARLDADSETGQSKPTVTSWLAFTGGQRVGRA